MRKKNSTSRNEFFHASFRHNGYSEGQIRQALNPHRKSCTRVSYIYYCYSLSH